MWDSYEQHIDLCNDACVACCLDLLERHEPHNEFISYDYYSREETQLN